jgi:hypothetical protein
MTKDERKQLKINLVMFAKAYEYLAKQGLRQVLSTGYRLSSTVFEELYGNQFTKEEKDIGEYAQRSITIEGHKFFALFKKE